MHGSLPPPPPLLKLAVVMGIIVIVAILLAVLVAVWNKANIDVQMLSHEHLCETIESQPSIWDLRLPRASATWMTDLVPKIVHHTAPSDKGKWPPLWHKCYSSFLTEFPEPEYKHVMWTDEDIIDFVRNKFPSFSPMFMAYKSLIHRVDVVRYLLLYMYGGIYADMDVICYRNFYRQLPRGKASIAESPHLTDVYKEEYQNALMASPALHPFWHYVMSEVLAQAKRCPLSEVLHKTGPQVIIRSIFTAPHEFVHSLPKAQFAPSSVGHANDERDIKYTISKAQGIVYASHLGTCKWCK